MTLKSFTRGRPRKDEDKVYNLLKLYYDNLRNSDRIVTVGMLSYELKRLTDSDEQIHVLQKRVYRWLQSQKIVQQRVTHVDQNARYKTKKDTVNQQISCGKYPPSYVANIDKTKFYFGMTGAITLGSRGSKTVSVKSFDSS